MISTRYASALVAATMLSMASAQSSTFSSVVSISTPTPSVIANAMTDVGCFDTGEPLEDHGYYLYQTLGNCQRICIMLNKPVLGLVDGTNCWCGEKLPPKSAQVSNSSCDTQCSGYDVENCGGPSKWWISLSGTTKNKIEHFSKSSAASTVSRTAAAQASEVTSTVVVTATDTASKPKDNGPNKAGIAAGVVVGVVVLAGIIAGVIFYLRHKRRREVEEEYRRQAAVNSFVGGKLHTSNSSMTDSRLDPEFMARRASNGSIADNQDYSRRILKVTNPDGH